MQKIKSFLVTVVFNKKFPYYLAGIGLALYIAQTALFTQIRVPNMDEGAYLFKGLQYARGASVPFEPYSFWTNKMYLTFYLFGWIQRLIEPGLLVARIFAATLGVFSVIGIWLMARRFSNNWIAVAAVWAMALNPTMISIYSIGNSQVVVIFFLVWSLVFSLGADRRLWEIVTGSALAAILVLCRENMIFVLPLLSVYFFWQQGKKKGFLAIVIMSAILVIGHLIFWPEILYLWERWLPFALTPEPSFIQGNGLMAESATIATRIHSLSLAIRVFIVPMTVLLLSIILCVKKSSWKSAEHFKTAVFIVTLLVVLIGSHTWASIGNYYCVYCTTNYYAFFMPIGLVLFAVSHSSFSREPSAVRLIISLVLLPVTGALIGFAFFEKYGYALMKLAVPRVNDGKILPGTVELWQLLNNKFQIAYESARMILPTLLGFLIGIALLWLFWIIFRKSSIRKCVSFSYYCSLAVLIAGLLTSPLLSWPTQEIFSKVSVPGTFKKIGETLARSTSPGDKIYIDGLTTAIPLLYAEDLEFLPPQINVKFSFVDNLDTDTVARSGFWNGEIARDWRRQSEVFIIGQEEYTNWLEYIEHAGLVKVPIDIDYSRLPDSAKIYIFKRP
jgi:hypothetical protein